MPFSLVAHLPLGTYRGNRPDRAPERVPSVARLHAALLCAAGFGPRAVETDGDWEPCADDAAALRWLEENPPTDVQVPALRVSRSDAIAYRADGTIRKPGTQRPFNTFSKQDGVVAVDGPFVWSWRERPPNSIAAALRELCPDVAHLGTAESPVLLTADDSDMQPTHRHDPDAGPFGSAPGIDLDLPSPGRLVELSNAHRAERSRPIGSDRVGVDERSSSTVPPRRALRTARYRTLAAPVGDVPWAQVLLVPLDASVPERDRVRWAVAAHKAMIRILDRDSPPLLTGVYPEGVRRPPNRVGLHFVDRSQPVDLPDGATCALAVLVPHDTAPADLDALYRTVGQLRTLELRQRGRDPVLRHVRGGAEVVSGDRFWREPAAGHVRLWRTDPAAVPDTRGHDGWTFTHAAMLSLGFVWQGRGIPRPAGRGAARDAAVVDAVNGAGAAVVDVEPIRHSRVGDYVHHVHQHAVVRPYRATLFLGDLGGPTTVLAIGQSRHLGGGLLVPDDRPEGSPAW